MKGTLIVIEGTDGSGKATQTALLSQRLAQAGHSNRCLEFPRYGNPSAWLAKTYLDGGFGRNPGDVNAYAASMFYAADRFASWAQDWRQDYQAGGLFLADRYTTANAVHQAAKLPEQERPAFFAWLADFEFDRLGLPRPDLVLYLDMPTGLSEALVQKRGVKADIHESNDAYLRACRLAGREAASYFGWQVVACTHNGTLRPPQAIHEEVFAHAAALLGQPPVGKG